MKHFSSILQKEHFSDTAEPTQALCSADFLPGDIAQVVSITVHATEIEITCKASMKRIVQHSLSLLQKRYPNKRITWQLR